METSPVRLDKLFISSHLKIRDAQSHKGNHGHALLVAGNRGKMGAAVIAARACLRTGAGLLTVNVPEDERVIMQVSIPEAMLVSREHAKPVPKISAVAIGPAIGLTKLSHKLLKSMLDEIKLPMLLDADALTLCAFNKKLLHKIPPGSVITPHPGEFDRLFGMHFSIEERQEKALQLSLQHPWIIVLKGQYTQVSYNGKAYLNTTGNPGLAKGGSGDALTGMILSFLAQGYAAIDAAVIAVYLHGLAADIALRNQSEESLLATDVVEAIGMAFQHTRS